MQYIPYSRQDINEDDIQTVCDVLRSDFLTTGPQITTFENTVKQFCNAQHAIALSNGTAALHIALLALNIKTNDIVWTTPISFVASANAAIYTGAQINFIDIDPKTGNICISQLTQQLEQAAKNNTLPKALIIVHFTGRPCDMPTIHKLAQQYNFKIIEDAAHALGSTYKDNSFIGNCQYSNATIFSFHPVKAIATGEGGMITTNNQQLADKARLLTSHGITRDPKQMTHKSDGPWYYQQLELGFNHRITDIQCALGTSQMSRLNDFINARKQLAQTYHTQLANLPITLPPPDDHSSWHLYIIHTNNDTHITKHQLFTQLREKNIGVNVHYIPIHTQPYYQNLGFKTGDFPQAENFYQTAISIPLFPSLKQQEQNYIINTLTEILS